MRILWVWTTYNYLRWNIMYRTYLDIDRQAIDRVN